MLLLCIHIRKYKNVRCVQLRKFAVLIAVGCELLLFLYYLHTELVAHKIVSNDHQFYNYTYSTTRAFLLLKHYTNQHPLQLQSYYRTLRFKELPRAELFTIHQFRGIIKQNPKSKTQAATNKLYRQSPHWELGPAFGI